MGLTYVKRFRMEIDLRRPPREPQLPIYYHWVAWDAGVLEVHAEVKCRSFRQEPDAAVFPCLGDAEGCRRLMWEIAQKQGFLPSATWLAVWRPPDFDEGDFCGTIQGVATGPATGAIQNVGVVPEHRGHGLGRALVLKALAGFRGAGVRRVDLEVTAQNRPAVRLYRSIGFRKTRTVYKVIEVPAALS